MTRPADSPGRLEVVDGAAPADIVMVSSEIIAHECLAGRTTRDLGEILLRLLKGHSVEPLLVGFAEINGNLFDRRGDQEQLRADLLGKQGGGKVLVDDRGDTFVLAIALVDNRDAAAARADHVVALGPVQELALRGAADRAAARAGVELLDPVLRVLGVVPFVGLLCYSLASIWMLVAMVVAVRQALDLGDPEQHRHGPVFRLLADRHGQDPLSGF